MTVCTPLAHLFKYPDLNSEHIDEVLFGTEVTVLDEITGFYRIKTAYGYEGYTKTENILQENAKPNMMITLPFADLLCEDKNFYMPKVTLHKGSLVDASFSKHFERYAFVALNDKRIWYIHKAALAPLPQEKSQSEIRESIAAAAISYLGTQYRWGGKSHEGIDCSGLTFMAYYLNGITIWRDAVIEKSPNLKKIPLENAKKSDLLFFKGHIALYLEKGLFIHASASEGKVCYGSFDESSEYYNDYLKKGLLYAATCF